MEFVQKHKTNLMLVVGAMVGAGAFTYMTQTPKKNKKKQADQLKKDLKKNVGFALLLTVMVLFIVNRNGNGGGSNNGSTAGLSDVYVTKVGTPRESIGGSSNKVRTFSMEPIHPGPARF